MPKERTYTSDGHVETQWSKHGRLVCLVSREGDERHMHQFTDRNELRSVIRALRRAERDAWRPQVDTER